MKLVIVAFLLAFSQISMAASSYTLEQICRHYDDSQSTCEDIPFCSARIVSAGCQLAAGAPEYVRALCDLNKNNQQTCGILQDQGNCVWVYESQSFCVNKKENL